MKLREKPAVEPTEERETVIPVSQLGLPIGAEVTAISVVDGKVCVRHRQRHQEQKMQDHYMRRTHP